VSPRLREVRHAVGVKVRKGGEGLLNAVELSECVDTVMAEGGEHVLELGRRNAMTAVMAACAGAGVGGGGMAMGHDERIRVVLCNSESNRILN